MKYPCNKYNKSFKVNQKSICCDVSQGWTHLKSTKNRSDKLGKSSQSYYCYNCYKNLFSYQNLTNIELSNELTSNDLNQSTLNIIDKHFPEMEGYYLSVQDFYDKYGNCKDLFILHLNTNSLNNSI